MYWWSEYRNVVTLCRGGEEEKEEEVTVDTHGLTSYQFLKKTRDTLHKHYRNNDFKSMVEEAEPLVEQVEEIEEEKHSLFREVMVMMMYACIVQKDIRNFSKACTQYAKGITEISEKTEGQVNEEIQRIFEGK